MDNVASRKSEIANVLELARRDLGTGPGVPATKLLTAMSMKSRNCF